MRSGGSFDIEFRIETDDSWDFFTEPDPSNGCKSLPPLTYE